MPEAARHDGLTLHASCVAFGGHAVLITGASGSGKSSLALTLMAYGCNLVSDDQTTLTPGTDGLIASAPKPIQGLIEARGIGLLNASQTTATLALCVDLNTVTTTRLPPQRSITYIGHSLPLICATGHANFPAAVLQMLKAGRRE